VSSTFWTAGYSTYMLASKTTDGGSSWTRYQLTASTGRAYTLAMDPSDNDMVYVGGYEGSSPAIYVTSNSGSSWSKLTATGLSGYVYDLALHPTDANTIFAGTGSGIYRSTNGGSSFSKMGSVGNTRSLLFDPDDPTTLYAGTYSQGVWVSYNGGVSWQAMNDGLDASGANALSIHPDSWVFAGTSGSSCYRWNIGTGIEGAPGAELSPVSIYATPNPVYSTSSIHFSLPDAGDVRLAVYDMSGRLVSTLVEGGLSEGAHSVSWNATEEGAAAGVYFFRLETGGEIQTGRLVLIR
jgi:photosystem II stability/assembly factor-like uncharacterized protein